MPELLVNITVFSSHIEEGAAYKHQTFVGKKEEEVPTKDQLRRTLSILSCCSSKASPTEPDSDVIEMRKYLHERPLPASWYK